MTKDYDFIIIGAGPAGMTAAVYASRAGMRTALLEAGAPGGKLLKTNKISNWPGIKEEPGSQLAMDMFEHSTSLPYSVRLQGLYRHAERCFPGRTSGNRGCPF